VVLRAAVARSIVAREWLERIDRDIEAHAPELIWIEAANGLQQAVRRGILHANSARLFLSTALALPITLRSHRDLAAAALLLGLERGLSAHDASYVVLADGLNAKLVTADKRLARLVSDAELIS
jgi:predicted nucleic acid-binding protein